MDIASFEKREQELRAQELVLEAYSSYLAGDKTYSPEEAHKRIREMIEAK